MIKFNCSSLSSLVYATTDMPVEQTIKFATTCLDTFQLISRQIYIFNKYKKINEVRGMGGGEGLRALAKTLERFVWV